MAYDPTNGEKPIDQLPQYGGAGGSRQAQEFYAAREFSKLFGRNPTQSELASLSGAYAGDPNIANTSQGDQAVAQYFQNFSNNPEQINKQNQDKYLQEAPQHFDAVNQLFQSHLGRAASQDELNHFGSLLASGSTDPYQLQQFLQQQPEYQTKQNEQMRSGLRDTMATNDTRQFSEQILPSIQQAYAKQGRSFDSSAFANSAALAAQQQNTNREGFLNNLTASQYGGVQDRAYQDYASMVANQQGLTNAGINAQYSGMQNLQGRLNNITDYNTQQQAYNDYLNRYGKRSNGLGGVIGGVFGGLVGAKVGGASGAATGYQMGSGVGTAIQNSGGSY